MKIVSPLTSMELRERQWGALMGRISYTPFHTKNAVEFKYNVKTLELKPLYIYFSIFSFAAAQWNCLDFDFQKFLSSHSW